MPAGTTFGLTAAQLAQTVFVAGAAGVSDDIYVQVSDGQAVSGLGELHVNVVNHAPVLTVATVSAAPGQTLQAVKPDQRSDADNDALTYNFLDNSPAANSGHFVFNGTVMPAGTTFGLTRRNLRRPYSWPEPPAFPTISTYRSSDGHAVSSLGNFHINNPDHAPVLTVANVSAVAGQTIQAQA